MRLSECILLRVIDNKWMDHIDDMDQLREGIGLQAYGQRDPVVEYKFAGFDMFNAMIDCDYRGDCKSAHTYQDRAESRA